MGIKHAFTSAKSDGGDATLVRPSNWNADHVGGPPDATGDGQMLYSLGDGSDNVATPGDGASCTVIDTYLGSAANIIDGNDLTNWASNTAHSGGPWLRIDLGASKTIYGFKLVQSTGDSGGRSDNYDVQYSTSSSGPWTTIYNDTSAPYTKTAEFGAGYNYRYWRIISNHGVNNGASFIVYTVELYGSASFTWRRLDAGSVAKMLAVQSNGMPGWQDEFDATVPTTQAFGDAAATGSAATAARRDHRHGMPAPSVGERLYLASNFR